MPHLCVHIFIVARVRDPRSLSSSSSPLIRVPGTAKCFACVMEPSAWRGRWMHSCPGRRWARPAAVCTEDSVRKRRACAPEARLPVPCDTARSGAAGTRCWCSRSSDPAARHHGQLCLFPLLKHPFSDFLEISYSFPARSAVPRPCPLPVCGLTPLLEFRAKVFAGSRLSGDS